MQLRFEHVHYRCSDLDETRRFYCDVMGAEYLDTVELSNGRRIMKLNLGGVLLFFSPAAEARSAEPASERMGAYHIAFFVDDLEQAVAYYKKRGARFAVESYMASPTLKVAFIEAPDGMQIELMERL